MKKLIFVFLFLCTLIMLTSCKTDSSLSLDDKKPDSDENIINNENSNNNDPVEQTDNKQSEEQTNNEQPQNENNDSSQNEESNNDYTDGEHYGIVKALYIDGGKKYLEFDIVQVLDYEGTIQYMMEQEGLTREEAEANYYDALHIKNVSTKIRKYVISESAIYKKIHEANSVNSNFEEMEAIYTKMNVCLVKLENNLVLSIEEQYTP